MSWVMSAHSLRKYYDDVVLYTDTIGKHLLIDTFHLPYTEVCTVFDDFPCLPQHWALSKIKTYSMQIKPFIHIDGDIFITEPLPKRVKDAPLVAQNREIGTIYYRRMMARILEHRNIRLPEYINKGLREDSIASYNMGFFGGTDLDFIHRYCQEVFDFMEENHMNDASYPHSCVDCNVFFEQVILAVMTDREGREVTGVLDQPVKDEGYTRTNFCDLDHYGNKPFYHILGGHKRNQAVCEMMDRAILRMFPKIYYNILSLFPERHERFSTSAQKNNIKRYYSIIKSISEFETIMENTKEKWKNISKKYLLHQAIHAAKYQEFTKLIVEKENHILLNINPYCIIYQIPAKWNPKALDIIKNFYNLHKHYPLEKIALIPTLSDDGIEMLSIIDFEYLLLQHIKSNNCISFDQLRNSLINEFKKSRQDNILLLDKIIIQGIKYFIRKGFVEYSLF